MSCEYIVGEGSESDELSAHIYEVIDGVSHHYAVLRIELRQWDFLAERIGKIIAFQREHVQKKPPNP